MFNRSTADREKERSTHNDHTRKNSRVNFLIRTISILKVKGFKVESLKIGELSFYWKTKIVFFFSQGTHIMECKKC